MDFVVNSSLIIFLEYSNVKSAVPDKDCHNGANFIVFDLARLNLHPLRKSVYRTFI